MEVSRLLRTQLDSGLTRKDLASALGIGQSQLRDFVNLGKLDPDLQDLAGSGHDDSGASIPFSSLAQVAALNKKDQAAAVEAVLGHSMRWSEVVELAQLCRRSDSSIQEAVGAVVARRPTVETKHLLLGTVHEGPVRLMLSELSQNERDRLFEQILSARSVKPASVAGRLGARSFTVVSDESAADLFGADADDIEAWDSTIDC